MTYVMRGFLMGIGQVRTFHLYRYGNSWFAFAKADTCSLSRRGVTSQGRPGGLCVHTCGKRGRPESIRQVFNEFRVLLRELSRVRKSRWWSRRDSTLFMTPVGMCRHCLDQLLSVNGLRGIVIAPGIEAFLPNS